MKTDPVKRAFAVAVVLLAVAAPASAQEGSPAPVGDMPALSPDLDDKAAGDRIRHGASQRATQDVMQGKNPYTNSQYQPPFPPTFVGTGADLRLVTPGAAAPIPVCTPTRAKPSC